MTPLLCFSPLSILWNHKEVDVPSVSLSFSLFLKRSKVQRHQKRSRKGVEERTLPLLLPLCCCCSPSPTMQSLWFFLGDVLYSFAAATACARIHFIPHPPTPPLMRISLSLFSFLHRFFYTTHVSCAIAFFSAVLHSPVLLLSTAVAHCDAASRVLLVDFVLFFGFFSLRSLPLMLLLFLFTAAPLSSFSLFSFPSFSFVFSLSSSSTSSLFSRPRRGVGVCVCVIVSMTECARNDGRNEAIDPW